MLNKYVYTCCMICLLACFCSPAQAQESFKIRKKDSTKTVARSAAPCLYFITPGSIGSQMKRWGISMAARWDYEQAYSSHIGIFYYINPKRGSSLSMKLHASTAIYGEQSQLAGAEGGLYYMHALVKPGTGCYRHISPGAYAAMGYLYPLNNMGAPIAEAHAGFLFNVLPVLDFSIGYRQIMTRAEYPEPPRHFIFSAYWGIGLKK